LSNVLKYSLYLSCGCNEADTKKQSNMKNLVITKGKLDKATDLETIAEGVVAFQMVKIEFNYHGFEYSQVHDTKIMANGNQFVYDGDGFINSGFSIN
jgi:hypothetical protein